MAVLWITEITEGSGQKGKHKETYEYTRAWRAKVDDPRTPKPAITNATGVQWLDPHPDDDSCKAQEFDTKPEDDTGIFWIVTVKYFAPPVDEPKDEEPPGTVEGLMKYPIWAGSSSAKTTPAMELQQNNPALERKFICNSAGDPLEGLEMEISEPRLSLTQYYLSHVTVLQMQRDYTDTTNNALWNGGAVNTWRCLGCSFSLQVENQAGVNIVYWEVQWEFAYDRTGWNLKPWDVGFAERAGEDGVASMSGDKRKQILGVDKKPVRQPVALANGIMKEPLPAIPDVINAGDGAQVYQRVDFMAPFGEVYTPGLVA